MERWISHRELVVRPLESTPTKRTMDRINKRRTTKRDRTCPVCGCFLAMDNTDPVCGPCERKQRGSV